MLFKNINNSNFLLTFFIIYKSIKGYIFYGGMALTPNFFNIFSQVEEL